jgi:FlaA1/EpsC-like NDP-sugar epimerase
VNVYNNDEYVVAHMKEQRAKMLLVSPLKNDRLRSNDEMINHLIEAGIKIYMTPPAKEYTAKEDLDYKQLHEVDVEDLLPREKIEIDMEAVGNLLRSKRILITGAAGSIGSEMVRQIAPFAPAELILVDQAETPLHDIRLMMKEQWPEIPAPTIIADISNAKRMEEIFAKHRPDYVFHAAAYKHVPMMEDNPVESVVNNIDGTRIIADAAVRYGTKKFVMISTDKAVNPTNVMGCSKRICEIYVQSLDSAIKAGRVKGETQFVTTRFGNVLGSNGSVIPLFQKQIAAGGPITVTHPNIIRFFMLIPEACKLVLEAGTMGNGGEIFVFDMGKPVRIADLAKRMIQLSGAKNVEIKYTGLRDGEKLYEEVLNDEEVTLPTFHQKIKIAKVRQYPYEETGLEIAALVEAAKQGEDDMSLVARMKAIVPEYKSQHSIYEQLDHK